MAIVTIHRSFGNDKFPLKAVPHPHSRNHVCISVSQLKLVCSDFWRINLKTGTNGVEYGLFSWNNVNFL